MPPNVDLGNAAADDAPRTAARSNGLDAVLTLVRARSNLDFGKYKRGTLQRRTERRMRLRQLTTIPQYLRCLRVHPEEVDQLASDLLIGVTSFFRDAPAFEELASPPRAR